MFNFFLTRLFWIINYSICSTLKYKVINEPPGHSLFAVWHSDVFALYYWARRRKICILPTETWRGESIVYVANKYGLKVLRFLDSKTPLERAKVLADFISLIKQGYEAAMAVDGPPPPVIHHQAKPGILYLSRKTGVPVVATAVRIKRKIIFFWRWDRIQIPLPWSEVDIHFGPPYLATASSTAEELDAKMNSLAGE